MMSLGKQIRMRRIINSDTGKTVIVPMDHGMTLGPIRGLEDVEGTVGKVVKGGANAIVLHKGLVREGYQKLDNDLGLIVHMSVSTKMSPYPNNKVIVCSVEEAIKLGADAVSIHVNLGNIAEANMLSDFGKISREAYEWGMPLISMVYARDEKVNEFGVNEVKHAARVAVELGSDIVKVSYTGDSESFHEVVKSCPIPVVIAGGDRLNSDRSVLEMVKGAIDAGAAGVSLGRNIFQHSNPEKMVMSISSIIHNNGTVAEALDMLG